MYVALLGILPAAFAFEVFEGQAFYVGEPHSHTSISADAVSSDRRAGCGSMPCGTQAGRFDRASEYGLDWVSFTDHVNGPTAHVSNPLDFANGWSEMLTHDDEATGLVVVPAAEVWITLDGADVGHRNVYFFGDDAELAPFRMTDAQPGVGTGTDVSSCEAIQTWMEGLEGRFGPTLLVPHHTMMLPPMLNDWTCRADGYEVAAEVYSHWGTSLGWDMGFDPGRDEVVPAHSIHAGMDPEGPAIKMAFLGGTDSHTTDPGNLCSTYPSVACGGGLTVVVAPEDEPFDRGAIYDAFLERRTFATSGPILPVIQEWSVDGALVATLGQDLDLEVGQDLEVQIRVPPEHAAMVTSVWLIEPDGQEPLVEGEPGTWTLSMATDVAPSWAYVAVQVDGRAWFGTAWCDDAGNDDFDWIWMSPTWFHLDAPDADMDGYPGAPWGEDCDDADALVFPGAEDAWYDGLDSDCDGADDMDADADGHRPPFVDGDDCDDLDPATHPAATEVWYDGLDADCDGRDDFDADGDGHVHRDHGGDDCDDGDPHVYPGGRDRPYDGVDANCDGWDDFDGDRDGQRATAWGGTDCDDRNPRVRSGARDRSGDAVDSDCDGLDD